MKKYLHTRTPLGNPFKAQFLFLFMLFSSVGVWGQVNITPVRTDVSGFTSWTDTNVAGTTYIQLLKATSLTISPAMDFDAYTSETLDFTARTFGGSTPAEIILTVSISTDNGGTWTVLGTRTPASSSLVAQAQFDLSAYSGTQVKVKFSVAGTVDGIGVGIDDINIRGIAASTPKITVSPATLTGLDYVFGSGPSTGQSYSVSGSNLTPAAGNITVTAPSNFSVSKTLGGTYSSSFTYAYTGGTLFASDVFVRLNSGLAATTYGPSNVTNAGGGATTENVAVSGAVTSLCTAPTNQATTLSFNNITSTSIDISFTAASPAVDKYLVVQSTSATLSGNPADASNYAVSSSLGGGTVVYNGTGTSFTASGLSASTQYYYFVFAYNDATCSGGPKYKTPALSNSENTISGPCFSLNGPDFPTTGGFTIVGDTDSGGSPTSTIRLASGSSGGSISTTATGVTAGSATVKFRTKGWSGSETSVTVTLDGVSQNITTLSTSFNEETLVFASTAANPTLEFSTASGKRVHIGNVKVFCIPSTPKPVIKVKQGTTNITTGTGIYGFGNQLVNTSSSPVSFTIENTGNADLTLGTIALSGTNADQFSITQAAASLVSSGSSTTFTGTFSPTSLGSKTATVTIPNNAGADYTFTITGTGSNSAESTIVDNTGTYSSTTPEFNISTKYIDFTDNTNTSTGKYIPMKFKIVDGISDTDGLSTILTGIKFTVKDTDGTDRILWIKKAILTTSGGTYIAAATTNAGQLIFSGMSGTNVTATTHSEKIVHLRVAFDETQNIIDNTKLIYKVVEATADTSGSAFAATDGGGAETDNSTANNRNRIVVTATKLAFLQGPSSAGNGVAMVPAVTVVAVDANSKTDLDFISPVTLTCSTPGALTSGGGPITPSLAVATFGSIIHGIDGTYTMTASATGYTSSSASSNYTIATVSYANNSFLSKIGTGSYMASSSWSKCGNIGGCVGTIPGSGGWGILGADGSPSAASTVFVQGNITLSGGALGVTNSTILSGGNLVVKSAHAVSSSMLVKDGGTLTVNEDFNMKSSSSTLTVENNANIIVDYSYNNDPTPGIFDGVENFYPQSNFYIYNWDVRQYFMNGNVTLNNHNGYTAAFGNIYLDAKVGGAEYNDGIARQNWDMLGTSNVNPINLTHGNFIFVKTPFHDNLSGNNSTWNLYKNVRLMGSESGIFTVNIRGDLKLNPTWVGTAIGATKGNFTLNVGGSVDINSAGTLSIRNSAATGNTTLAIAGNLNMNGTGTTSATRLLLNENSYTISNGNKAVLNLNGNLTVGVNPIILTNSPTADTEFNFTGSALQSVNVASVIANSGKGIPITVKNGASVQLINNNLLINNSSPFTVEGGATLDFGYDGVNGAGTGGLYIGQPASPAGTNTFTSAENSILKITSPDGLYGNWDNAKFPAVTAATGNLRLAKSNRTINTLGTFWYIGKLDQKTGDAPNSTLATTSNTKTVIAELSDNNKTLSLDVQFGLSGAGLLDIRKGKVLETTTNYIFGSTGGLKMATGTKYKVVKGDTTEQTTEGSSGGTYIPRMQGTYTLDGGEIELAGSGSADSFQTLRGSRTYYDLTFSGGGSKTLSNGTSEINGLISIMNTTTLDGKSYTVGKAITELLMDSNSLFKTGGNGTKPDAGGDYVLDETSTIEFQGSSATKIRITPYENVIVSGTSVEPGGLNLLVNQKTAVTATGRLKIPLSAEGDPSYVLTSTKGIDVSTNGVALFENNAQLMQSATASNSGSILMQRNATIPVSTFNQYVYWSSPVIGQDYTKIFPGQPTTAQYYIESNDRFGASAGTYILGRGLAVKNPVMEPTTPSTLLAEFKGTPYVGDFDYSLFWSNAAHGYNLVGNPYPSNLDLNELYISSSNIESTFRFWDNYANSISTQQGSNYNGYAYAKYNAFSKIGNKATGSAGNGNGDPTSLSGLKEPNYILKVGQGFIARATALNAKLGFKNNKRITVQTAAQFFGKNAVDSTNNRYWLEMVTPTNLLVSNAIVYFDEGTNEFSADDSKLEGQASDALFTNAGDEKVVINGRSTFADTDVVKVGNRYFSSGIYDIRLGKKEGIFENGQNIYLKDKIAGIITNLGAGNYTFSADAGEQTGRFEIIYKPESVLATGENTKDLVQVYRNGEDFIVQSGSGIINEVEVFDASGRLFQKVKGGTLKIVVDGKSLVNGMYILKIKIKSDLVSKKIMK